MPLNEPADNASLSTFSFPPCQSRTDPPQRIQPAVQTDLVDWLRLEQTAGVGLSTARLLLTTFGLPANIFASSLTALQSIVSEKIALSLLAPVSDLVERRFDCALAWAQQPNHRILTLADQDYPASLLNISDPPLLLYVMGRIELLTRPSLAVVGSRNATVQGNANAERFSEMLSQRGLTIISGLALGIDSAAHRGALRCLANNADCGGSTVAVIGTGADIVYPARNRDLAHQIAAQGCIVSEYPLGMSGIAANFPRRNRIISGLSSGVLVIEAAAQSGSLITARMAAEQGREVFAIPGSIHSPLSKGCHQLIKQGAKLVESAQDILEEMLPACAPVRSTRMTSAATEHLAQSTMTDDGNCVQNILSAADASDDLKGRLLTALGFDPASLDVLAARSGLDIAALNTQLLTLELEGLVEMLPGGVYRRLG